MKEILIIQAARFGDLLQTRRLAQTLAARSSVHLAIDSDLVELAGILYPGLRIHGLSLHRSPSPERLDRNREAFSELASAGFDEIYICNFSGLSSAISRLFDPGKLRGYRPGHDSLGGLLRSPWVRTGFRAGEMRSASPLNLVDFWAWFADRPVAPKTVNPSAKPGGKGLGIVLAGREARRSLPVPVQSMITSAFFRLLRGPQIRLFGTAAEAQASRKLVRSLPPAAQNACLDLCGKTSLADLASEIQGLDLLVTPDTGIMHLAAFLGVPVLAFFLSSAWCHETGPYGEGHIIFQTAPACAPCLETSPCRNGLACHAIFSDPGFSRLLVQAAGGAEKLTPVTGLQVWRTGFDDLGATLSLLAGNDPQKARRSAARSIMAQLLEISAGTPDPGDPDYMHLLDHFLPDSEWMLPPWRYC